MELISAVGMVSSVLSLVDIATKTVHHLDTLREKWGEASLRIVSLRSQVELFRLAFEDLSAWMQNSKSWYIGHSDSFIERLNSSLEGSTLLLGNLEQKVDILSKNPGNPSKTDKLVFLWSESGVKEISGYLHDQASALQLLLQCRTLSQQDQLLLSEPHQTVMRKMTDNTDLLRKIQEGSSLVDRQEEDLITINELLQDNDDLSVQDVSNSPVYGEHLVSQFEQMQLSASRKSSQDMLVAIDESSKGSPSVKRHSPRDKKNQSLKLPNNKLALESDSDPKVESLPSLPMMEKFRILIIGQAGVGKSTLCAKILGLNEDEAGVNARGVGTPVGKVWEEITFPGQNENLILHDSGGFEAGSEKAMQEIKSFIDFRKSQVNLTDQLHCIWYCVSCWDHRPIQEAEKYFFENIQTEPIPVIAVFTQYDTRTREHFNEWMERQDEDDMQLPVGRKIAAEKAYMDYLQHYKGALLKLTRKDKKLSICRIGFNKKNNTEVKDDGYGDIDPLGTPALIKETLDRLDNYHVRLIWMVAQRGRADYYLKASVEACVEHFWTVQKFNSIPFPILGVATIGWVYSNILGSLSRIWKLNTDPPDLLGGIGAAGGTSFLEASLGQTKTRMFTNTSMLAYNFLGPLSGSLTAKIVLKIIVGCSLLFERLFWLQESHKGPKPIEITDVWREADDFKNSSQRQKMSEVIELRVKLSNCYNKAGAKAFAQEAVDAAKKSSNDDTNRE